MPVAIHNNRLMNRRHLWNWKKYQLMVLTSGICECQNSCTMYNNVKHVRMSNAKIKEPLLWLLLLLSLLLLLFFFIYFIIFWAHGEPQALNIVAQENIAIVVSGHSRGSSSLQKQHWTHAALPLWRAIDILWYRWDFSFVSPVTKVIFSDKLSRNSTLPMLHEPTTSHASGMNM